MVWAQKAIEGVSTLPHPAMEPYLEWMDMVRQVQVPFGMCICLLVQTIMG